MGNLILAQEQPVAKSFQQLGMEEMGESFSGDALVESMSLNLYKALGIDRAFRTEEDFLNSFSNINKALATGTVAGLADATALRLENLDDVMTSVLFDASHLVLQNWIPRTVSKQPVFEWNRRLRYGGARRTPGFQEGGTPRSATGAWERNVIQTKYMGVRRGITHQALTTGLLGGFQISPTEEEERSGTLGLLEIIERWLFSGDSALKEAGGSTVNYDGLKVLLEAAVTAGRIDDRNVIDLAGQPLIWDHIDEGALNLYKVGKLSTTTDCALFLDPSVSQGLSLQKAPAERVALSTELAGGQYVVGTPVVGYKTNRGALPFKESIFLDEVHNGDPLLSADEVEATAPAAPPTLTSAVSSDTGADWAGTYYYFVSALNDGGESLALVDDGGSQAVTADQKVTLTIGRVADAHGYRVYRGVASDGSDAKFIGHVAQPASGTASFVDQNRKIPGTTDALILHSDKADLVLAQMSPLIKFPLGIVSTTIEFLLLLYHVLVLKAPERVIWYKNVGSYIA